MAQELQAYDAAQFIVGTELAEESYRRTSGGILAIHGIAEVRGETQTVDDEIEPFARLLPLGVFL